MYALATNGALLWAKKLNAIGTIGVGGLECDAQGKLIVAGCAADGPVQVDGSFFSTSPSGVDAALFRFDASGTLDGSLLGL
ncbi:MAG: hypothetical protein IPK99_09090 [Flavobacteriales bacterium]|nr:hypothetical protein [Flavobacteriales bacterium]